MGKKYTSYDGLYLIHSNTSIGMECHRNGCVRACVCGIPSSFFPSWERNSGLFKSQLLCKASHSKYEWHRISSGIFVVDAYAKRKLNFVCICEDGIPEQNSWQSNKSRKRIRIIFFVCNHKRFVEKKITKSNLAFYSFIQTWAVGFYLAGIQHTFMMRRMLSPSLRKCISWIFVCLRMLPQ